MGKSGVTDPWRNLKMNPKAAEPEWFILVVSYSHNSDLM
jgi:hypothetical protein